MEETLNLQNILINLEIERSAFEALVAQVHPAQLDTIPVQDGWTIKDILAHIAAWECELLLWLEMAERGEQPDIPLPGNWSQYIYQFNQRVYLENQARPVSDVQQDFQRVYAELRLVLENLPDDHKDQIWSVWYGSEPPWRLLATFYEHYREHSAPILYWLQSAHTRPG